MNEYHYVNINKLLFLCLRITNMFKGDNMEINETDTPNLWELELKRKKWKEKSTKIIEQDNDEHMVKKWG